MPEVLPIPTSNLSPLDAWEHARERGEPALLPINLHSDDRGWSIMNQLQGVMDSQGQINISLQHPGVIKAWHRHKLQTDFWICVRGDLKVGVHRTEDDKAWAAVIGEHRPALVIIPPSLWHGAATVGSEPASLLYYVTHEYNPKLPDEERRAFNNPAWFPWSVQFR